MKFLAIVLAISMSTVFAQRNCNSHFHDDLESIESQIREYTVLNRLKKTERGTITIPVVVHVLYSNQEENIDDSLIHSQIEVLNEDFGSVRVNEGDPFNELAANLDIQFELAQIDPDGNPTNGINRVYTETDFSGDYWGSSEAIYFSEQGGVDNWDPHSYLNVWVMHDKANYWMGYASFPFDVIRYPQYDGVVCDYRYFGRTEGLPYAYERNMDGHIMTHEVGHWLGLFHPWGDETCGDDQVEDTPFQYEGNFGGVSDFSHPYNMGKCPDNHEGEMYMNYMDFADDQVVSMFTHGQKERIDIMFRYYRSSFLESSLEEEPENLTLSTNNQYDVEDIQIFPNPSQGIVTIKGVDANFSVDISDISGTFISSLDSQELLINEINLSYLDSGIYFLTISDGQSSAVKKLCIQ